MTYDWCVTICDCDSNIMLNSFFFFFFFIKNLLHGARGKTVVTTFVAMYRGRTLTWNRNRRRGKENKQKRKGTYRKEEKGNSYYRNLIVIECKHIRVGDQKHREMFQCVSSRVPIPVESLALMKNMSPWLDGIIVTRKVHAWEKL